MSQYENFIKDFPGRCLDILRTYEKTSRMKNREVTLMLTIATSGLIVPFERLRLPSDNLIHPARDRENFQAAKDEFDKVLQLPFLASRLWKTDARTWIFAKEIQEIEKAPDFWAELNNGKALSADKKVTSIVKHLRNALGHGNLFTTGDPIRRIIFLSRNCEYLGDQCVPSKTFAMLATSPQDFLTFLTNWLQFLSSLPMPTTVVQGSTFELVEYRM